MKSMFNVGSGGNNDIEFLKMKADFFDQRMKCPVCNTNWKEVILPCNHMFCESCMTKNIESRQRICPLDRMKISKNDVKKIPWGDGNAKVSIGSSMGQ